MTDYPYQYEAVTGDLRDPIMAHGGQGMSRKLLAVGVVGIVIIASLLVAVIVLAVEKNKLERESQEPSTADKKTQFDLLSYFGLSDGLDIKWFLGLKNTADLNIARSGKYHVLNIKVVQSSSVPVIEGGMRLRQFLDLIQNDNFAVNFYVTEVSTVLKAISELQSSEFNKPVMFSVPVLSQLSHFNLTTFLQYIEDWDTDIPVGIGYDLTSFCCDEAIGVGTMEYVASLTEMTDKSASVEVDSTVLVESWSNLKWLLDKEDSLRLVISSNHVWNTTVKYDLLLARNDADMGRIFYSLAKVSYDEFVTLASTAGSPLIYFDIHPRDAGKIIWSHNTDTWDLINKATAGDTMMVEGDIRLDPNGSIPIMAHDLGENNNLTFSQWLEEIIKVDKGMKLDCKELQAVKPALRIVKNRTNDIKGPIWANADVLPGPGGIPTKILAADFLNAVKMFPGVTLSLGWTTIQKGANYSLHYTMDMVREMHEVCRDLLQPVTFPIRAEQSLDSWESFDWLLQQSRRYTLTVWTGHGDNVTKSEMDAFKQKFEMSRVYFDLPEELRPYFV